MDRIYLDNHATTPMLPEVIEAMRSVWCGPPGNPASGHSFGRAARRALEDAREKVAHHLDARADEVLFTSGATEANNLAIFGLAGVPKQGARILSSPVEHPCVLEPLRRLEATGFALDFLPISRDGIASLGNLSEEMSPALVALMLANHETGAIQPVAELARKLDRRIPFHCDAAAAVGKMPVSFRELGVTSLTVSAHKIHGPIGVGALVVRKSAKLQPLQFGGHQQQGKRPGTESPALAVGFATALEWCVRNLEVNRRHVLQLRQTFLDLVTRGADPVVLNGPANDGLPHTINLSFPGVKADALLMALDLAGVACSTGSACSSGSLLPSPVVAASGARAEELASAMRFSLSPLLSKAEIEEAATRIVHKVNGLRRSIDET